LGTAVADIDPIIIMVFFLHLLRSEILTARRDPSSSTPATTLNCKAFPSISLTCAKSFSYIRGIAYQRT
jgi:hypothetical protein